MPGEASLSVGPQPRRGVASRRWHRRGGRATAAAPIQRRNATRTGPMVQAAGIPVLCAAHAARTVVAGTDRRLLAAGTRREAL